MPSRFESRWTTGTGQGAPGAAQVPGSGCRYSTGEHRRLSGLSSADDGACLQSVTLPPTEFAFSGLSYIIGWSQASASPSTVHCHLALQHAHLQIFRRITHSLHGQTVERSKAGHLLSLSRLHNALLIYTPGTERTVKGTMTIQDHATLAASFVAKTCRPQFYCPPQSRLNVTSVRNPPRRAVFLDRDGTLVEDIGYLTAPSQLELLPNAVDGIRLLQDQFLIVIVTNQSAVARGLLDEEQLYQIHHALARDLQRQGALLDAVYACPHHPLFGPLHRRQCHCRKPQPGMLLQAMHDFDIQPHLSFMVGDKISDIAAGQRAGMAATVLIKAQGPDRASAPEVAPTYVASNFYAAAKLISGHRARAQLSESLPAR